MKSAFHLSKLVFETVTHYRISRRSSSFIRQHRRQHRMSLVLKLPKSCTTIIASEWLTVDELAMFDTAVCNSALRILFLKVPPLGYIECFSKNRESIDYFNWLRLRNFCINYPFFGDCNDLQMWLKFHHFEDSVLRFFKSKSCNGSNVILCVEGYKHKLGFHSTSRFCSLLEESIISNYKHYDAFKAKVAMCVAAVVSVSCIVSIFRIYIKKNEESTVSVVMIKYTQNVLHAEIAVMYAKMFCNYQSVLRRMLITSTTIVVGGNEFRQNVLKSVHFILKRCVRIEWSLNECVVAKSQILCIPTSPTSSSTQLKAMTKKAKLNNDFGSKAMKEMEDNNESDNDNDSEPMDDEDEEEYDEEDEDDEDIENLPRMFYEFAVSQLEIGDKAAVQKALVSSEKAKTLIIETNEDLKSLLTKALKRKAGDNKVPPGSGLVTRNISDNRFFLSLINILQARAQLTENNVQNALKSLREALIWFPRSIEANYLCGEILRGHAVNGDQLSDAENYYIKAVETLNTLQKTIDASNAAKQPQSALQQRLAANLSNNSSTSTTNSATNTSKNASNFEEDESNIDEDEYNQNLVDTELCCGDKATQALILYYCQTEGCDNKAYKYLAAKGYKLKLSNQVLQYPITNTGNNSISASSTANTTVFKTISTTTVATTTSTASAAEDSATYLSVIDNAMEKSVLSHLSRVFRPESPFWSEHHYDTTSNASKTVGYFSYLYPMRERAAKSSIEQIIDKIYPLVCAQFPQAAEANIAEWWVHSRPHINGHQLHFDSDETRIESGRRPAHPIVSCVLFVEADVGGPTLVTNQKITGDLATKGWMAMPETNRLVTFDASYLHGVIPGRGTNPSLLDTSKNPRRLTFMVGFWREICAKPRGVDSPGPSQPLPDLTLTKYTWPLEMTLQDTLKSKRGISGNSEQLQLQKVVPIELTSIWEPIESRVDHEVITKHSTNQNGTDGKASSSCSNSSNEKISYNTCFQGF